MRDRNSARASARIAEARQASYGRRHTGALLPVHEYGSGPVDHEIGGSRFERSGLTPLERVFNRIATRPRLAKFTAKDETSMASKGRVEGSKGSTVDTPAEERVGATDLVRPSGSGGGARGCGGH